MRRALLALATLLGLSTAAAHAQYICIIVNLNATRPGGGGPGGQQNMGGMFGVGGMDGGVPGMMGGVGAQGSPNNLGFNFGLGGGPPMPPGNQGNMGNMGTPPMPPGTGAPPGTGGVGMFGAMGGEGMFGGGVEPLPPLRVMAVIEVTKVERNALNVPGLMRLYHKYGNTIPAADGNAIQAVNLLTRDRKYYPAVSKRYDDEYQKVNKKGAAVTTEDWLGLARWALEHGLLAKYVEVMDNLAKKEKDNPKVIAYLKVKEALAKPLPSGFKDMDSRIKHGVFEKARLASTEHYELIHYSGDEKSPDVASRLKKLEDHYQAYYYWFALRGQVMPMPSKKMVAALVPASKDPGAAFYRNHKIFDEAPISSDAFLARRQNLVVLSSTRLDEPYQLLDRATADLWREFDRDLVLKWMRPNKQGLEAPFCAAQTISLLMKALEEDSERAAIGHEGARQIVAASGMIPPNVQAPEWLQSGMGSLFETPKGSPWPSHGAPHWQHLFSYEELKKKDKDFKDPGSLVRKIITDTYFRESAGKSKNNNGSVKARATAWALTYYLANEKTEELLKYYKELAKLPRDLELEDKTLEACFTRAFGSNLGALANDFARFIDSVHPDAEEILKELYKLQNELADEMRGEVKPGVPTRPGTPPGLPTPGVPGSGSAPGSGGAGPKPGRPG